MYADGHLTGEFNDYLECVNLALGFLRLVRHACGRDKPLSFSCKHGALPSVRLVA